MTGSSTDPMIGIAEAISSLVGHLGVAFIEDEHLTALADTMRTFLQNEGITIDEQRAAAYYLRVNRS